VLPLADRNPTRRTPVITVLLILVNVGVFVLWQGGGSFGAKEDTKFAYEHGAVPCELVTGRPITAFEANNDAGDEAPRGALEVFPDKNVYVAVLVSMFLHGGWIHLLGNMLFLWIFGNNIEDRLGPVRFVAFYLVGGLVATGAQVLFDTHSTVPLVGASGAIAGVMGAYLIWYPSAPILTFIFFFLVEIPASVWLVIWFVLQFFTSPTSGVAYMAHIGGFVFGLLVALSLRDDGGLRRGPRALPSV